MALAITPVSTFAGAWVAEKNSVQVKLSYLSHTTSSEFILSPRFIGSTQFEPGNELPIPFNGISISKALALELRYGLLSRLEVRAWASYFNLQFNDDGGNRRNTGLGDMYAEAIYQLSRHPLAASIRAGVKVPTGDFDIDPKRIPLGEDQWDVEGSMAAGKSFYPIPVYTSGEVGYRHRFENKETRVKPGDELFFLAETGLRPVQRLSLKVVFEGLFGGGRESREFGFLVKNKRGRELLSLTPYVSVCPRSDVVFEFGFKFLLTGQDHPSGTQYIATVGYGSHCGY